MFKQIAPDFDEVTRTFTRFIGVQSESAETMRQWMGHVEQHATPDQLATNPFLAIDMPCGEHVKYPRAADVPLKTVRCPCGDPTHWFILIGSAD